MPDNYALRDGVSFCRFATCAIILDVDADRYWRVDEAAGETLENVRSASGAGCAAATLERLVARGFITPNAGSRAKPTTAPPVATSAVEFADAAANLGQAPLSEVAWSLLAARHHVRRRRLMSLLGAVRQRRSSDAGGGAVDDLAGLAAAFRRSRRLLPLAPRCLPDSLALLAFLARRGHFPRLVFGVEADPFAAHCWVQHGDVVLNDARDHAAAFKPILVV